MILLEYLGLLNQYLVQKLKPMKLWLASLGKEKIDEVFDPELAINRAVEYYRRKSYGDDWIKERLISIVNIFKLTDIWKEGGIEKSIEFAMLTNEIYKSWSCMKASEYKTYKGIRKESLRDNMTDIEIATRDIALMVYSKIWKLLVKVTRFANDAKNSYEKVTNKSAISSENALKCQYIDDVKVIWDKQ